MNLLPNRLQLDVLKRHVGPFIFCFVTLMFLLLMQFLILYIDMLVGKGLPFGVIVELIITNLASMVVLAVPMAVLVACLMAYGKFSELNELTALRAAGVNPFHVISPVLGTAVLLSIFLIWFSNDVLPDANQRARSLFIDIRLKKPGFDLKEDEFYEGIDDYTFLVEEITNESDSLQDITIYQHSSRNRNEAIIRAKEGHLESSESGQTLTLFLQNGTISRKLDRRKNRRSIDVIEETTFDRHRISFDLSELAFSRSNPQNRSRNDRTMDINAMMTVVDSLQNRISKQKQQALENTRYIVPYQDTTAEGMGKIRRLGGEEDKRSPAPSSFIALNHLENRTAQDQLKSYSMSKLRGYKSLFEETAKDNEWRITKVAQYLVEVHKKFSIPIACIIFVLIGAPIGMYTKKGNLGYAALIGTVFLTFYWISIIQGEKLADRLFISPTMGMWFSNGLLGIIGIYLTVRYCSSFKISNLWKKRG